MVNRSEHNRKARWKAVQAVLTAYRKGSQLQPLAQPVAEQRIAPSEKPQLSFGQERLWFLSQLGGDNTVYNLPFAFWIDGDLDVKALEKSLQEILRRHDILRTTFPCVAAQAVPVIAPTCNNLQLSVTDLRQLAPAQQETRYQSISQNEISRPFDLAQGPLWRFQLLRFTEEKYVLLMTIHHIIYDGWSQSVFTKELSILYKDFSTGQPSSLPDLPIQYADFAHWQRQWLTGEILQYQRSYWQQQLAGDLPTLHLPFERPQAVKPDDRMTYKGDRHPVEFSPELTAELQKLADRQGVTLFVVLLAAFNLLLYQYTQQEDIIICSTQAGRNLSKIQGLIGFFNTVVPLRTNLSGNPSFLDLLDKTHQVVLDGYQYQDMPLQLLADAQNLAHKRLYQVMLVLQNTPSEVVTLPGIQVKSQFLSNGTANFDLFLSLISPEDPAERLTGYLEYKTDLFTTSAIGKLLAEFQELLANIVENPHQQLSDLPLLVTEEQGSPVANLTEKSTEPYIAPRTPIEQQLAEIWSEVLGQERISIYDNFFRLGGHSLLATQVISRVNTAFGAEFPILPIFQHPTIAALAEAIEARSQQGPLGMKSVKIQPVPRENKLPLSFAQQQLWFLDRFGSSVAYNLPIALVFSGSLNVTALHQTLQEIVDRHESLRTTFSAEDGIPYQVIHSQMAIDLPIVDLSSYRLEEREIEVKRLVAIEANRPFNLSQDLMLRATLLHLGQSPISVDSATNWNYLAPSQTHHILLLTIHHIAADGWSIEVLLKELTALYSAFSQNRPSPLTNLSIQYADFAVWQRQWLQGEVLEKQLNYWKQQLANSSVLNLPTDHPRPAIQTFNGKKETLELPKFLLDELKQLAQREGVTLFMILLAAFQVILHRYSQQDDIVVGSPIANRNRQEWEPIVGMFVNTLVLRTDLGGNPTFSELLQRVREVATSAYTHQDLPFEKLVEEVQSERDPSRNPLFQVMFAWENAPQLPLELAELKMKLMPVETETAMFDLMLTLEETASSITGSFEYNTDLFDASTIERMAGHFQTLLEAIVANPQQRVSELPLLQERERYQLLVESNNTTKEYPFHKCIHELFEEQVERSPDAIAVVYEDKQLTYRELNQRANRVAHHLQHQGVGPEVLVGICVERSLEMVIGLLGVLKAGGAYVPLNPTHPSERTAFMLEDSSVSVLLTQQKLVEQLPQHTARVICLDSDWEKIAFYSSENPSSGASPENLAYVIYTSGSTGKPKGVLIQHRSLVNYTTAAIDEYGIEKCDRVLQFASISFDASVEEIYPCLTSGATLVLRTDSMLDSIDIFMQKCRDCNLSVLSLPTAYWHELTAQLNQKNLVLPSSLRLVIIGGEKALTERWKTWVEYVGQRVRLVNTYGPTEATVVTTICDLSATNSALTELAIGRPISNVQTYILDRYQQPVPIGIPGELHIGGDGLARGYLNRPNLTDDKFIPNTFSNQLGSRLYKTGDLACYMRDGNIEFLGRIDNQVKIRGFRIELGEIEALLAQHPDVLDAAVIVREDIPGNQSVVAYITPNLIEQSVYQLETQSLQRKLSGSLRDYLKQKLPTYMIPTAFVLMKALPLNSNGKIDRRALPAPLCFHQELEDNFVAPRTPIEEMLAAIWVEVLGLKRVGINDNFFELGGHSLQAMQLISKLSEEINFQISVKLLFQHPTIVELAEVLNPLSASEPSFNREKPQAKVEQTMTAIADSSPFFKLEHRSLLSLFAVGKIASVDSATLGYLPLSILKGSSLTRNQILQNCFDNLPMWDAVIQTKWGRIAGLTLPIFEDRLYSDPQKLVQMTVEALEMAGRLGAKTVSLTGFIPSATDYGHAIVKAVEGRNDLPKITTGHAISCATIVHTIKKILLVSQRSLEQEKVAFIGLSSVGLNSLRLMLRCLPHPSSIILCDVYSNLESIQNIQREIISDLGFRGSIEISTSTLTLPPQIYDATLIIGATNIPDILDIQQVKPNTLIVDYYWPHSFSPEQAIKRFEKQKDILFTEGGVLQTSHPIKTVIYLSESIRSNIDEDVWPVYWKPTNPLQIAGCVLSGLLSSRFDYMEPTVGLLNNVETCVQHYQSLERLGFEGADLHCLDYVLPVDLK